MGGKLTTASEPARAEAQAWRWEASEDAQWAYGAFFATLALGQVPPLQALRLADLPYFMGLATLTIYIGAHRGLASKARQQISLRQGALAPVAASAALFGAYLLVKWLPDLNLQTLFDAYFWLVGALAVAGGIALPLRRTAGSLGATSLRVRLPRWLLLGDDGKPITSADAAPSDFAAALFGLAVASVDLAYGHKIFGLNNMIACLIATDILQLLGLRSFRVAAVLLAGLLAYDVFWVFGSPRVLGDNVMLAVATSDVLVGPTRLLFPRAAGGVGEASGFPFSLLGLGDVVVPGLLACLTLRFDASRATDMRARAAAAAEALHRAVGASGPGLSDDAYMCAGADAAAAAYDTVADSEAESRRHMQDGAAGARACSAFAASDAVLAQRTYFVPTIAAYVLGLGLAFVANAITHLGQPALLYLVPATLGAVGGTALLRGELDRVDAFTDAAQALGDAALAPVRADEPRTPPT
ncbi:hypothetical protein WJX81_001559 [Elliptochloris bilobata]|uniref:Signal peptide peptidase n=1 Tax=Elliptochloris bilobata TaxID=381761 RepID=A0AAW1R092_9CHLO